MITRVHMVSLVGAVLTAFLLRWHRAEAQDSPTFRPPAGKAVPSAQGIEGSPAKGYRVLGKGPVHEAYAQPYRKHPGPTPIVPRMPPAPIPEEPPNQKPVGDNVQWIPGYWAWDIDKNDFVWISGLWRMPPPGREWVPGYWAEADGGPRWTPGYWADANQVDSGVRPAETDYLPEPPASLDNGPNIPAPDDNSIYEPGNWIYRSSRYVWRPGVWTTGYADWVWNPPGYSWTPAGYTYVNGYWDYPLADRGLLFAPVSFNQPLWENPGWAYQPNCVFGVGGLLSALFCRSDCCSYYYGNYFSPAYAGLGFQPWCDYGWRGYGYDPLFNHDGWANRFNPGWYGGLRDDFLARRNGLLPAPAGTLARQVALAGLPDGGRFPRTVTPLQQFHGNHGQLTRLIPAQLAQQRAAAGRFHRVANQRTQAERAADASTRISRKTIRTATPRRFAAPGGHGLSGSAPAGQAGASALGHSLGNRPGNRTAIPSQGEVSRNRSAFGNGTPVDARSVRPPAAKLAGRPGVPGGASRQSFYSGNAAHFGRTGGQALASPRTGPNGSRFNSRGSYPAARRGAPTNSFPQNFPRAPAPSFRSPQHPGSSYRLPSRSAASSSGGSPRLHGGRAPPSHGTTPSFHGGGSSSGRGHSNGSHGSGGHSGGRHRAGGHDR